jgi:hypothetical protein
VWLADWHSRRRLMSRPQSAASGRLQLSHSGDGPASTTGTLFASSNAPPPVTDLLPNNHKYHRFAAPDFRRRQLLFDALRLLRLNHKEVIAARPKHAVSSGEDLPPIGKSRAGAGGSARGSSSAAAAAAAAGASGAADGALVAAGDAVDGGGADAKKPVPRGMYAWGAGYYGQLGLSNFRKKCRMEPAFIEFKEPVLQIACGGFHTALLTDSGRVYTWGDGRNGQLGNLPRTSLNTLTTPTIVPALCAPQLSTGKGVVCYIACGLLHTAAVTSNEPRPPAHSFAPARSIASDRCADAA